MKIGIDARMWAESGLGRYIRNLVRELVSIDDKNTYVLYVLSKDLDEIRSVVTDTSRWKLVEADFRWYSFKEQLILPVLLYKENLDLVHFPHFNIPIFYFKSFVVTIHDLTHFSFAMERASTLPSFLYQVKHAAYSLVFRVAVRRSKHIFTVSNYVKQSLQERFFIPAEKIEVTYESAQMEIAAPVSRMSFSESGPYFFYVGNAHPHKNIEFLIHSFQLFRKEHPEYRLVLSGKTNYFWERLQRYAEVNKISDQVVFTGFVTDAELSYLYQHAAAFVFPSLSEGFGLPLLEAMQYGCPVLSSQETCLPEVGGDAALYFDPRDQSSLVEAMQQVVTNNSFRAALITKGYKRIQSFSWKQLALDTLRVYSQ